MVQSKNTTTVKVNGKIECAWDGRVVKCKGCGKWIGWGVTAAGKKMPFDHGDPNFTSHFASCPQAKQFRKYDGGFGNGKD